MWVPARLTRWQSSGRGEGLIAGNFQISCESATRRDEEEARNSRAKLLERKKTQIRFNFQVKESAILERRNEFLLGWIFYSVADVLRCSERASSQKGRLRVTDKGSVTSSCSRLFHSFFTRCWRHQFEAMGISAFLANMGQLTMSPVRQSSKNIARKLRFKIRKKAGYMQQILKCNLSIWR